MSRRDRSEGQLFIGRLGKNCRNSDLEDVFEPYGRLLRCEIKYGAEMAYGFVDYEDRRDAEDAIKYENGREVAGSAIIVEWAKGTPRRGGGGSSRDMRDSRGSRSTDDCYRCRRTGHWARDCPDDRQYGYRRPSRRSPRRSSYRSRSRSRDRDRRRSRSRSRDRRRRRSRSRSRRSRSRSYDRKRSASKSRSRSRSRSRSADRGHDDDVNGDERSKSGSRSPDRQKSASPS